MIIIFFLILSGMFNISAGQDFIQSMQAKMEIYNRKNFNENLYVHTDKSFYLAGEIIWFRIYCLDAETNKPSYFSKIAYVEVLDKNHKSILQAKISLKKGEQNGSFHLPLSISSGHYLLRAYTNWMKNQGPQVFFQQQLTIVNTLKNPEISSAEPMKYYFDLFPEGGNLVNGITSRIAFKGINTFGKGVDFSGIIVEDGKDTIVSFVPLKFGMGNFNLTPVGNHVYKALVKFADGSVIQKKLPEILNSGCVMKLNDDENGHLGIKLTSDQSEGSNTNYYLIGRNKSGITVTLKQITENHSAEFLIDKATLGKGVSTLTIFNALGTPVCERLYFIKPEAGMMLNATSSAPVFTSRDKLRIEIKSTDKSGKGIPAELSVSVFKIDSLQEQIQPDIFQYLWLTSELKGYVESAAYYFSGSGSDVIQAADNLLMAQGWRRFSNEKRLDDKGKGFLYPPEFNGHIVTCRVTDRRTGRAAGGIQTFLTVPAQKFKFSSSETDSSGLVHFDIKNFYGAGEIMLQTNTGKDSFFRVEVLNPFSESYNSDIFPPFIAEKQWKRNLEDNSISMQVQNIYHSDSLRKFYQPDVEDSLPFFGKADYSYFLDDYTRFTTMEEVLREYVKEINVGAHGGSLHVKMLDESLREFNEDDILLMVDGVPLPDVNKIFAYDPLKFKKLDIIPAAYIIGPSVFKGIASFTTYNGNPDGLDLDQRILALDYEGMQLQRQFYVPEYENPGMRQSHLPDFRTTLYWAPNVATDKNGAASLSFFTSDVKGNYMILIQGIDENGNAGMNSLSAQVR